MNKRGISPLIATVLLVSFVVILAGIIMFWGKQYVTELMEKKGELATAKLDCESVVIEIVSVGDNTLTIRNNSPNKINGLMLRFIETGDVVSRDPIIGPYEQTNVDLGGLSGNVDVIPIIRPQGLGAPPVPCSSKHKLINR